MEGVYSRRGCSRTHIVITILHQEGDPLTADWFIVGDGRLQLAVELDLGPLDILEQFTVCKPSVRLRVYDSCTLWVMAGDCPEDRQIWEG